MTYELWLGDCLQEMDRIKVGSVDMILADLPYGTTACGWDVVIPFEPLWKQYKRVIKKNGAVVLFGSQPFNYLLWASNPQWFRYEWTWDKSKAGNFSKARSQPLRTTENILVFCQGSTTYNPQMTIAEQENKRPRDKASSKKTSFLTGFKSNVFTASEYHNEDYRYPVSLLRFKSTESECNNVHRLHPTQKPVALLEYLIRTYTNPGELVLDNTMGSGSTGEACLNTGRRFIGIEKDAGYYQIGADRLERVTKRLTNQDLPLFAGVSQ